jgi:O-antigen/teichoic acid export membrane protein
MVALMAVVLAALVIAAPLLVPLALGSAYSSSVDVFRIYLLVILVNAANQPLLTLLQANGQERFAGNVVALAVAVGLIGIASGARFGGAKWAAVGSLLVQLVQLVLFLHKAIWSPGAMKPAPTVADLTDGAPI